MRGEYRRDADAIEQGVELIGGDAGLAKAAEGSAKVSALRRCSALIELEGEAAAFAVIGLGEVDELEVEAEGAGELVGGGKVEGVDAGESLLEVSGGGSVGGSGVGGFGLAAGDGDSAKGFDGVEDGRAGLLAENLAEEHAEGADVAAEWGFFEVAGGGFEFGEALGPVLGGPEGLHPLIMP
jgi:hypothetical protein